jgi:cytochrome c oxidase, subunit II
MFSGSSSYANTIDGAFLFIVIISLLLLIGITVTMIFFVVKYNRKKNPKAVNIEGNIKLEILWTAIPVLLVTAMFWYGWVGYVETRDVPADAMVVKVTGQMWIWKFEYGNGIKTDTLYVPVYKAVRLNLNSLDVNHSFYIPAFRIKKDAIANRNNYLWFRSDKIGSYDVACAEYCGLRHSYMYTKIVVMPQVDYDKWYAQMSQKLNAKNNDTTKTDTLALKK